MIDSVRATEDRLRRIAKRYFQRFHKARKPFSLFGRNEVLYYLTFDNMIEVVFENLEEAAKHIESFEVQEANDD